MTSVLVGENLVKTFVTRRTLIGRAARTTEAVRDVSLRVEGSRTLGLVGESGSGKTTVGRMLAHLLLPDSGRVHLDGEDVTSAHGKSLKEFRRRVRIVFQDPFSSLDPRMLIGDSVGEALTTIFGIRGWDRRQRVKSVLERVGLSSEYLDRYPFELSGGQLQRVAIARALVTEPSVIICDEAVSALDMSIRADVLNLLLDVQRELGVAYVFISHDLSVVRHIAHSVAVMYHGEIVEEGDVESIFETPRHEYTKALLSAIPMPKMSRSGRLEVAPASDGRSLTREV